MGIEENDQVVRLFTEEVPEIASGLVEIKAIARMPGLRSKVAIQSRSPDVDAFGACVGVRGSRLHRIIDRLDGERIELVHWTDDLKALIVNALQPARIDGVQLDATLHQATAVVTEDQLSLVSGIRGSQNRELASRLCGWPIEVVTRN